MPKLCEEPSWALLSISQKGLWWPLRVLAARIWLHRYNGFSDLNELFVLCWDETHLHCPAPAPDVFKIYFCQEDCCRVQSHWEGVTPSLPHCRSSRHTLEVLWNQRPDPALELVVWNLRFSTGLFVPEYSTLKSLGWQFFLRVLKR